MNMERKCLSILETPKRIPFIGLKTSEDWDNYKKTSSAIIQFLPFKSSTGTITHIVYLSGKSLGNFSNGESFEALPRKFTIKELTNNRHQLNYCIIG